MKDFPFLEDFPRSSVGNPSEPENFTENPVVGEV
jgi:hypothetical protein